MSYTALIFFAALIGGAQVAEAKAPPSIEVVRKEQAKLPACSKQPVVAVNEPDQIVAMRSAGYAVPADFCYPSYSRTLIREARDHRLSVTCGSLYDVDRTGAGRHVETRCDLAGDELDADWKRFFETAITDAEARASAARLKFEPSPKSDVAAMREGYLGLNFNAGGPELPPMPRFHKVVAQ